MEIKLAASAPSYLEKLNGQQRRAVEYGSATGAASLPLLVIAGAGSGKTNTLAHRVAHLIVSGADPSRIMLLTFSRRAASEMQRRVERIAGQVLGPKATAIVGALRWSGTFHAIGARLLREYALKIGLEPNFTIHDRSDSEDLMNLVRQDLKLANIKKRFPQKGTCLAIYSRAVNAEVSLEEVLRSNYPWCSEWETELQTLFVGYVEAKQKHNVLDYDDLLLYWAQMMREEGIASDLSARFDHVLVDEYQDTNRLQASILFGFKPDGRGVTVVGDDAQSIYSFRAATVRNILEFPKRFSPPAEIVTLERNYRSTQPILKASNAVIGLATERFTKNLFSERQSSEKPYLINVKDDRAQADYVIEKVLENREAGILLKEQAVLFRASSHSGTLEVELTRRNIPFVKFGGLKFLEAAHIKDVMAVLRWAENIRDRVAGFRVIQLLPGIGPTNAARLLDALAETNEPQKVLAGFKAPKATVSHWPGFAALMDDLRKHGPNWPSELDAITKWYGPQLEHNYDDAAYRQADLVQLAEIASGYPNRERFLTDLTLDPPEATSGEAGKPLQDEDYLVLSTIHSAKGQEWAAVFLLNAIDGCIPSDLATGSTAETEEERRLLYVALTRAKDQLHVMVPQRFFRLNQSATGDGHVYAQRTRFIPDKLLDHFENAAWPVLPLELNSGRTSLTNRIDIRATMRNMWR